MKKKMFVVLLFPFSWQLRSIDRSNAKTIIRLWHELNVAKQNPHDFIQMIDPKQEDIHIACVEKEEVRAIASYKSDTRVVEKIACAPFQNNAATMMIQLLNDEDDIHIDFDEFLKSQPSLYFELMFLNSNVSKVLP
jgi:hypothetical protein